MVRAGAEQLSHASRASADIEQCAQRLVAKRIDQRTFDRRIRRVQAAQVVPFLCMASKPVGCACFTRLPDRCKVLAILLALTAEQLIIGLGSRKDPGHRGAYFAAGLVRQPGAQEHPASLAPTLGQLGIAQDGNMARNPRLALAEHLGKLADGQFHRAQQPHDPEPGLVRKGAHGDFEVHRQIAYKDIVICASLLRVFRAGRRNVTRSRPEGEH